MAVTSAEPTLEGFLQLPEQEVALEYFQGKVSQKVSPRQKHGLLQFELAKLLERAGEATKSAYVTTEVRATFAGSSLVPDISGYRRERIPVDEHGEVADDFAEAPDLAIEIVSPTQSVNSLVRKCLWYVDNGVGVALLVDPGDRSVLVFRHGHAPVPRHGNEKIEVGEPLPDLDLTADYLFATLRLEQPGS